MVLQQLWVSNEVILTDLERADLALNAHDLYASLRHIYEEGEHSLMDGTTDPLEKIIDSMYVIYRALNINDSHHFVEDVKASANARLAKIEELYKERLSNMDSVLKSVLELYGAVALVSSDPAIRSSAEKLLQDQNIDIQDLLGKEE